MLSVYHQIKENRTGGKSTALIFVGLYFLLLAFFIYLNSLSVPVDEKISSVIGSIDLAFKGKDEALLKPEDKLQSSKRLGEATFHAELKQVYEAAIPLVQSEINEEGDQLQFTIPVSQLFPDGATDLRENRVELFQEIARVLIKRSNIEPTDMEILMDAGNALPTRDAVRDNLAIQRANTLVVNLMNEGVPSRSIFIGLAEEGSGQVHFKFYVRSTFNNQFRKEVSN